MKVGDQVVCVKSLIDEENIIVKKGLIYTILNVDVCKCGDIAYDIGKSYDTSYIQQSCKCGEINHDGIWWVSSSCFAPIQRDEFLNSDQIEKSAEEKIDIELPVEA